MKKKTIFLILLVAFAMLLAAIGVYFNMGHTSLEITYLNKANEGANVSNVRCTYELSNAVDLSSGKYKIKENKFGNYQVYHSSSAYGLYTYTFDIEVDGKTLSPRIAVLKTDWKDKYDIDINFMVDSSAAEANVVVTVNGMKTSKTFEDIQNSDIFMQVGP